MNKVLEKCGKCKQEIGEKQFITVWKKSAKAYVLYCENCTKEPITLDSLLKDNCKLAKELWGEEIVTMTDYLFGNEFKFLAFQYHLNQIADLISKGGSIQEYIDKTKI